MINSQPNDLSFLGNEHDIIIFTDDDRSHHIPDPITTLDVQYAHIGTASQSVAVDGRFLAIPFFRDRQNGAVSRCYLHGYHLVILTSLQFNPPTSPGDSPLCPQRFGSEFQRHSLLGCDKYQVLVRTESDLDQSVIVINQNRLGSICPLVLVCRQSCLLDNPFFRDHHNITVLIIFRDGRTELHPFIFIQR